MAKFIVVSDIAILDRGIGTEPRFTAIEGVTVDGYGALSKESLSLAKRALSNEAVKNGATRINQSNCIDLESGGIEASDDMIAAYNGGDVIYTSLQSGFAIEKFMILNHLLLPAELFKIPRIEIDGHYPAASVADVLESVEEITAYLPSNPTSREYEQLIDIILQESRIIYFSDTSIQAVLAAL